MTHVYPNPRRRIATRAGVGDHGDRYGARGGCRIALPLPASRMAFTSHFRRMDGSALRPTLHPKNLVPLAHLEHGGAFADTLTLFGADVGKPVEVPLDELERYAVRPFGVAITPDKSRIFVTCGGSEIVTVIDVPRLLQLCAHASGVDSRRISRPAPIT